ncbi:helix-turn-helix domain-containing protein [Aquimarina macrocephali]|uniref:helix-turn-helix domain-containing protein n=1 Tax=Aquimarina macrocephali TaxID=666563 RepID=UPI0004BA4A0F|nr:helix-turn-helix domain-containing protein [Aquimarina macrocephali]
MQTLFLCLFSGHMVQGGANRYMYSKAHCLQKSMPGRGRGEGASAPFNPVPPRPKQNNLAGHVTGQRQEWVHPQTPIPMHRLGKMLDRIRTLESIIGDKPDDWVKPNYGHMDYAIAHKMGWISDEEEAYDKAAYEQKRKRSLQTCHRYSLETLCLPDNLAETTGDRYTPQTSAAILNDNRLTDGAKILALKLMEQTYRENREGRWLQITVPYLMKALGRCRRTIQNYLRLLEHYGYIKTDVIKANISKMCVGLAIWLQEPLFPKHHKEKWPQSATNSGAQKTSYNNPISLLLNTIPINLWAEECMKGIYRSFKRNNEPLIYDKIHI